MADRLNLNYTPQAYLEELHHIASSAFRPPDALPRLRSSPMRSVAWRFHLGALPLAPGDIAAAHACVRASHEAYTKLMAAHLIDPHEPAAGDAQALDPTMHNPLSQHGARRG
jgi:hypothetical protein